VKVFVLNNDKIPLMPCYHRRAVQLLKQQRASVYRLVPFTIILHEQLRQPVLQPIELKIDPGSKMTGIALVSNSTVVSAFNLSHRGDAIRKKLEARRALRRGRRARNTRYRQARFLNRTRETRWLPPSLQSRVNNVYSWSAKLCGYAPVTHIAVETVRFNTQLMQNATISGAEYQQGELAGYEIREYLLEKYHRTCAYCDAKNAPLEIEHVRAESHGGSNRISNLTLACNPCNTAKGNLRIENFLAHDPIRLKRIMARLKIPLKDAAAVNATRYAIGAMLKTFGLPVSFWSGGRTKMNRIKQGYAKDHWIDAACVGESGANVAIPTVLKPLLLKAMGRGTRQVVRSDAYGFPRGTAKSAKRRHGFSTGDMVRGIIRKGKAPGTHVGRISETNKKGFVIKTMHGRICTTAKNLTPLQRNFGYTQDV